MWLLALLPLAVLACSDHELAGTRAVRGHLTRAFEVSAWEECSGDGPWWLIYDDRTTGRAQIDAALAGCGATTCVRFVTGSATVSGLGQYGHLGAYEREIHLDTVTLVSETSPSDCPAPN